MLPTASALAQGLRFLVRRRDVFAPDIAILASLVRQAGERAAGSSADEPAALFFAAARHGPALGPVAQFLVPMLAYQQAAAVNLKLEANETELAILRLRVVKRAITFEELCAWFAARLVRPEPHDPA